MNFVPLNPPPDDYPVIVEETTLDGQPWFMASHPDLPGCRADGATPLEAISDLNEARCLYIETLVEDGLPVPKPFSSYHQSTVTAGSAAPIGAKVIQGIVRVERRSGVLSEAVVPDRVPIAV